MKFEYGDFYKFLVSVGVALISLAIIIPWLFLREPFDLFLSQSELTELTTEAQSIIAGRQNFIGAMLQLIPWISVILLVVGIISFILGSLLWWSKTQKVSDELSTLNLKITKYQLKTLTPIEVKAEKTQEVNAEFALTDNIEDPTRIVEKVIGIEEQLISAIGRCMNKTHDVLGNQRLGSMDFDAIMLAKNKVTTDFVIDWTLANSLT